MRESKRRWLLGIILPIAHLLSAASALHNFPRRISTNARSINLQQPSMRCRRAAFVPHVDYMYPTSTTNTYRETLFATNGDDAEATSNTTIYKDDCFGFATFVAGVAVQDYLFTLIFVTLSLFGDVLTRIEILPPDPKRPYNVDRRVPGVVAILTLFLRYGIVASNVDVESLSTGDMDADLARNVQVSFCIFSFVTAFLDIRWRDRFDYPGDPV